MTVSVRLVVQPPGQVALRRSLTVLVDGRHAGLVRTDAAGKGSLRLRLGSGRHVVKVVAAGADLARATGSSTITVGRLH